MFLAMAASKKFKHSNSPSKITIEMIIRGTLWGNTLKTAYHGDHNGSNCNAACIYIGLHTSVLSVLINSILYIHNIVRERTKCICNIYGYMNSTAISNYNHIYHQSPLCISIVHAFICSQIDFYWLYSQSQLHWLPLIARIQLKVLTFTYRSQIGQASKYLCDLISLPSSVGVTLWQSPRTLGSTYSRVHHD